MHESFGKDPSQPRHTMAKRGETHTKEGTFTLSLGTHLPVSGTYLWSTAVQRSKVAGTMSLPKMPSHAAVATVLALLGGGSVRHPSRPS